MPKQKLTHKIPNARARTSVPTFISESLPLPPLSQDSFSLWARKIESLIFFCPLITLLGASIAKASRTSGVLLALPCRVFA